MIGELRKNELFKEVTDDQLAWLFENGEIKSIKAGDVRAGAMNRVTSAVG